MGNELLVTISAPDERSARDLARSAIEGNYAASARIVGPVTSVVRHEDGVGERTEWLLTLITHFSRYSTLLAHLAERHPRPNPEITVVEASTPRAYGSWVRDVTRSEKQAKAGKAFKRG